MHDRYSSSCIISMHRVHVAGQRNAAPACSLLRQLRVQSLRATRTGRHVAGSPAPPKIMTCVQYAAVHTFARLVRCTPIKKNGIHRELVNRRPAQAQLRRRPADGAHRTAHRLRLRAGVLQLVPPLGGRPPRCARGVWARRRAADRTAVSLLTVLPRGDGARLGRQQPAVARDVHGCASPRHQQRRGHARRSARFVSI